MDFIQFEGSMRVLILSLLVVMISTGCNSTQGGAYRHVVLFKFKADASEEQVRQIENDFSALKDKIDLVQDYEWGTNISPEGLDNGYTHCFFVTFKHKADLEAYLPHPEHKAFIDKLLPILDEATVIDYIAK